MDLVRGVRTAAQRTTSLGERGEGPALVLLAEMCLEIEVILSMGDLVCFFFNLERKGSFLKIFFWLDGKDVLFGRFFELI